MPFPGALGRGGDAAYGLGPPQNTFTNAAARDTYATANAAWLAQYNASRFFWIRVGADIERRNAAGDGWETVTAVVQGPRGPAGQVNRAEVYALLKLILQEGTDVTLTPDDDGQTIRVAATGGGGGGDGGGLTQTQVDRRITTLVNALALASSNDPWPASKIPAATEAAIGGVRNVSIDEAAATEGTAFRAWSAAMITKLIAVWRTTVSQAEAEAGTSTVARFWSAQRVRQAITAVLPAVFRAGNTDRIAVAKLGTGTPAANTALFGDGAWKTFNQGVRLDVMTLTYQAAQQAAVAGLSLGDTIRVGSDSAPVLYAWYNAGTRALNLFFRAGAISLPSSNPSVSVGGTTIANLIDTSRQTVRANVDADGEWWMVQDLPASQALFSELDDVILNIAPSTWSDFAGTVPDVKIPAGIARDSEVADSLIGLSFAGAVLTGSRRSGSNPIEVNMSGLATAATARGLKQLGFWKPAADSNTGGFLATGIMLPAAPADDKIYIAGARWGGGMTIGPASAWLTGQQIKALPTVAVGANSGGTLIGADGVSGTALFAGKLASGELLLRNDEGNWSAAVDFFVLFDPDGEAQSGIVAAAKFPLEDVASTSLGTAYTESFVDIDSDAALFNVGGVTVNADGRIAIPADGLYHIEAVMHLTDPAPSSSGSRRTIFVRTRIQRGVAVVAATETFATTYARGSTDAAEVSIEHNDWEQLRRGDVLIVETKAEASARNYAVDGSPSFVSVVGFALVDTSAPAVNPSISSFTLDGDLSPAAGAINETYAYAFAVAQSSHLSALRIVGFAGTAAEPSAVSVLATIAAADYHGGSGSLTVSGFSLAADETYTVRLEAYQEGQTPATDQPVSYHDVRITAHAATAQTRFIRVPRTVGSPAARPTGATLAAALAETGAGVIATAGTAIGDWTVNGIPTTGEWLLGWIVPQSTAQPNHYTQAGIRIDNVVADRFAFTQNSVDYYVYLFADTNWVDDSYNGSTIEVS